LLKFQIIVTAEKLGINDLNWFIYLKPPSYGPKCGLLPVKISIGHYYHQFLYQRPLFWKYMSDESLNGDG
jgi:hypothetical protein